MRKYLLRRLGASLITAVLASMLVFLIVRAVPGDVVAQMLGQSSDPEAAKNLRAFFGLDQSLSRQYLGWISKALTGNLGNSWVRGQPVGGMVGHAFVVTVEIAVFALLIAIVIGIPLGVLAGIYERRMTDLAVQ